jgi:hypothetical protein
MTVGVIFTNIMSILGHRIMRGQSFAPDIKVMMQARFIIVNEDRCRYVHSVYQYESFGYTTLMPTKRKGGFSPKWVTQVLRNTMMPYFILRIKHEDRLRAALTMVEFMRDSLSPKLYARDPHELRLAHETKNMIINAEMKLRASLFRTESRGTHYREDYPLRADPDWLAWVMLKEEEGKMRAYKKPIPEAWWPDLSLPYERRYPTRFPGE